MSFLWMRGARAQVPDVCRLTDMYHSLHEDDAVIYSIVDLFPQGFSVLTDGVKILGYGLAHPWVMVPPLLNVSRPRLSPDASVMFIHDVVVDVSARGHKYAYAYLDLMKSEARMRGLKRMGLVAVYSTHRYWSRYGFVYDSHGMYGTSSIYMTLDL